MLRVMLIGAALAAGAAATHPVYKVSPAIQTTSHQCGEARCRKCPCSSGFKCANWRDADKGGGTWEHTVDCVKDGNQTLER